MRLLTVADVAKRLDCAPETVRRRIRAGRLRAMRDGGLLRVPEDALAEYVVASSTLPAATPRRARRVAAVPPARRRLADLTDPLSPPAGGRRPDLRRRTMGVGPDE